MRTRIITSFSIILIDILLWFLPYTAAIYDYRTDVQTDEFTVTTAVGATTANVTLSKELYDNDTMTVSLNSDLTTDNPILTSYNGTTRAALVSGYTANATRTLEVVYDRPSFDPSGALSTFLDLIPWFWMLILAIFPLAALAYIWWGKFTGVEDG